MPHRIYTPNGNNSDPLLLADGDTCLVRAGQIASLAVRPSAGATAQVTEAPHAGVQAHTPGARDRTVDATSDDGLMAVFACYFVSVTGGTALVSGN